MTHSLTTTSTKSVVPTGAELVRGPTKNEMMASITRLFDSFSAQQRDVPERVAAAYVLALSDCSAWSIKEGIRRLTCGEVAGVDRTWLPSTAVVAHTVRTVVESSAETRERLWRRRLESWRVGEAWNPHWCQDPESPAFEFICPPHLVAHFAEATRQRTEGARR